MIFQLIEFNMTYVYQVILFLKNVSTTCKYCCTQLVSLVIYYFMLTCFLPKFLDIISFHLYLHLFYPLDPDVSTFSLHLCHICLLSQILTYIPFYNRSWRITRCMISNVTQLVTCIWNLVRKCDCYVYCIVMLMIDQSHLQSLMCLHWIIRT